MNAFERLIDAIAPGWAARRETARLRATAARIRHQAAQAYYDGATVGRRSASIRRSIADANTVSATTLPRLRQGSHDLMRNNPHARRAKESIVGNVVGRGIVPQFMRGEQRATDIEALAKRHLYTTECDAYGQLDYFGQVSLALDSLIEGGDVLIRRRWRRASDGLAVPVQFQVLEAEYLDESKDGPTQNGRIIQGVEFDAIGRRRGFWLYREHPGSQRTIASSQFVPARDVIHPYRVERPGQVRGIPWAAATMLRLADLADYEDAQLVKQKVSACFVGFYKETFDGALLATGVRQDSNGQLIDSMEPGMLERLPPGVEVEFGSPPQVQDSQYVRDALRSIAAGWGISYEMLTGDLKGTSFSSGRMGHLEAQRNIERWQRLIVIAQICEPLLRWWLEAVAMTGVRTEDIRIGHIPPRREMIDPTRELRSEREAIRSGQKTLTQVIREGGRDPVEHFQEYAEDMKLLDQLGIVVDSDARQRTNAGLTTQEILEAMRHGDDDDDELANALAGRLNGRHA